MPGLNQLKKFSEDVANLGNELNIREERGEPPVQVALPDVPETDDSNDFVLGMPEAESTENEGTEEDIPTLPSAPSELDSSLNNTDASAFPELDSILNPVDEADLDLSAFPDLETVLSPEPETPKSQSDFQDPAFSALLQGDIGIEEPTSTEFDLPPEDLIPDDNLLQNLNATTADISSNAFSSEAATEISDIPDLDSIPQDEAPQNEADAFDFTESSSDAEELPQDSSNGTGFDLPDIPDFDQLPTLDDLPPEDNLSVDDFAQDGNLETLDSASDFEANTDFSSIPKDNTESAFSSEAATEISDIPDLDSIPQDEAPQNAADAFDITESTSDAEELPQDSSNGTGFDLPDIPDFDQLPTLDDLPPEDNLSVDDFAQDGNLETLDSASDFEANTDFSSIPEDNTESAFSSEAATETSDIPDLDSIPQDEAPQNAADAFDFTESSSDAEELPQDSSSGTGFDLPDIPDFDQLPTLDDLPPEDNLSVDDFAQDGNLETLDSASDFEANTDFSSIPEDNTESAISSATEISDIPDLDSIPQDEAPQNAADAFDITESTSDAEELPQDSSNGTGFDLPDIPDFDQLPTLDDLPPEDNLSVDDFAQDDNLEPLDSASDFSSIPEDNTESAFSSETATETSDIPDLDSIPQDEAPQNAADAFDFTESSSDAEELPQDSSSGTGFDLPDIPDFGFDSDFSSNVGASAISDLDSLDEAPDFAIETTDSQGNGTSDIDFAAFDVPDPAGEESVHEVFDAPEDPFDGNPPTSSDDDGFFNEGFDDFDIPGFSDQAAGAAKAKPTPIDKNKREKNTLTEEEYETFKKNLGEYPLNLRIAIQEFIVDDEFKDNIVFEVIQKVLKKAPARQLAQHLEKLLDKSIPVPRDYERRTFEQYEEYKKSAEYQLKNRILPAAILTVMAGCILFLLFLFGRNVIYRPIKAEILYKEGYALLENNSYPQSELKFNEAISYQQKKRWFLRYADGYRQHKQYTRARQMYRAGLQRFNNDKKIGLEYATMELKDLRNFEEAEKIVRREVLDYHINDKDGLLLLGDIFLEWGDEKDSSKYEDAYEIYSDLMQLYGQEDLYLSRMMRYHIRVDNLREVLQYKEYFYPRKKALSGQDLVELSGYLLEKLYGYIAPADEYLLSSIEDVRELLERAVTAAPEIPESHYNLAMYFVHTNNNMAAISYLEAALEAFENADHMPRKRLLCHINSYRLLGELYYNDKEYILAEENYRTGIDLFEKEQAAGLEGTHDVGLLYADLGDLNYFVSFDLDEALDNYLSALKTENDTPSIRYRVGYIQYTKESYSEALGSFIKTVDAKPLDTHVLLALGNVLSLKGDNYAAQGYYEQLMEILEGERSRHGIMFPNTNKDHADIVDLYLKASNNLGVTQYRLAKQTGNSGLNAEALANLTGSLRAWDALTRNQETMVRLPGSNLAERNISYMTHPLADYEPAIYTDIPRVLKDDSSEE